MIRKACFTDIQIIQNLTKGFAEKKLMLALSYGEILERLRDFSLYIDTDGQIIGCVALHVSWENLAEIRSLAVREDIHRTGIGRKLIDAAIEEAKALGANKVFTLTFVPDFFAKVGFSEVERSTLPHKIWQDCMKCPFFPDCGEVAMVRDI